MLFKEKLYKLKFLINIGIKNEKKIVVSKNQFKNKGRNAIQKATVKKALNLIIKHL